MAKIFRLAQRYWAHPITLLVTILGAAASWLYFAHQIDFPHGISFVQWLVAGLLTLLIFAVWVATNTVPRARRKSIGVVLAISTESESEAEELRRDFAFALREQLGCIRLRSPLDLLEYRPGLARKVTTDEEAEAAAARSRAWIVIFGQAKRRRIRGSEQQVLDLRLLIKHRPIPLKAHEVLSKEVSGIFLPRRLAFDRGDALQSFWFSADWVDIAARYVAGLAAVFTGDLDTGEDLLRSLATRLEQSSCKDQPALRKIKNRLPRWLLQIAVFRHRHLVEEYIRTRDKALLMRAEPIIERLAASGLQKDYGVCLMRAICRFVLYRDVAGARRAIRGADQAMKKKDSTWRYSEAFLHAYEGNLEKARSVYRRAFDRATDREDTHLQTEEFIEEVLQEEPHKVQLHYCLGILNFHLKEDMRAVARDMKAFLAATSDDQWPSQREEARDYLRAADENLREKAA